MTTKLTALEAAEAAHKAAAERLRRERQKVRARQRRERDRAALDIGREVLAAIDGGREDFLAWCRAHVPAAPATPPEPAPEPATGPATETAAAPAWVGGQR